VIVSVLYLGTAVAVVLTVTYGDPATDRVAIGILLRDALGSAAIPVAAVIAVVISLGTTNAFIAGVSRLGSSLAADYWLPTPVAKISRTVVSPQCQGSRQPALASRHGAIGAPTPSLLFPQPWSLPSMSSPQPQQCGS